MLTHLLSPLKIVAVIALSIAASGVWAIENTLVLYPSITPTVTDGRLAVPLERLARIIAPRERRDALANIEIDLGLITDKSAYSKSKMIALVRQVADLEDFDIVGPMSIRVRMPKQVSNESFDQQLSQARQYLAAYADEQWPGAYRNIVLQIVSERSQLDTADIEQWRFDASHLAAFRRRTQIWALSSRDGVDVRIPLWFKVSGEAKVWRSVADLDAKTVVATHHFIKSWAPISEVDPINLAQPNADQRLTIAIERGDVLQKPYLEPVPAVQFGEQIQVTSTVGSVRVLTLATVTRTANVGEYIMLESLSSEEQFEVLVVGPDQVEVLSRSRFQ